MMAPTVRRQLQQKIKTVHKPRHRQKVSDVLRKAPPAPFTQEPFALSTFIQKVLSSSCLELVPDALSRRLVLATALSGATSPARVLRKLLPGPVLEVVAIEPSTREAFFLFEAVQPKHIFKDTKFSRKGPCMLHNKICELPDTPQDMYVVQVGRQEFQLTTHAAAQATQLAREHSNVMRSHAAWCRGRVLHVVSPSHTCRSPLRQHISMFLPSSFVLASPKAQHGMRFSSMLFQPQTS